MKNAIKRGSICHRKKSGIIGYVQKKPKTRRVTEIEGREHYAHRKIVKKEPKPTWRLGSTSHINENGLHIVQNKLSMKMKLRGRGEWELHHCR